MLTVLLYPFSLIYHAVTSARNRLYDLGLKPSVAFDVGVISVGNLAVGGTGKTPMIEYLIRLLSPQYTVATLSRGYGRKSKGIRIAGDGDTPDSIGDEPFQLFSKFRKKVIVAVGEDRVLAIPYILDRHPEVNLILLDDAYQHRRIKPGFQILLTDFNHLFVNDYLLPGGRLRESRSGAKRADVIVVTKCPPNVTDDKMMEIEKEIRKYAAKAVFFTEISYGNILPVAGSCVSKPENIVLVSGLANAKPLEEYIRHNFNLVKHFAFPDHHAYTDKDLHEICEAARKLQGTVVTTEKDMVKIDPGIFTSASISLNFLPIEIQFSKNGKEFDEMILNAPGRHVL
jgi:tetraacyldisaccharide 4'-kinase